MNYSHIHLTQRELFSGTSCRPNRPYGFRTTPIMFGNPKWKPSVYKVRRLLWKRSTGLTIAKSAEYAGWKSDNPARLILKRLGWEQDKPRSPPEVRLSVVNEYKQGRSITQIAKKFGVGTTTVFRWIQETGNVASFSERKAHFCSVRPVGRDRVGLKGVFHTHKGDCWIPTDSSYEYSRLLMLENDPFVSLISRCKLRFRYSFEGRERTYVPDLMITMKDGSVIVEEIKPERFSNDEVVLLKAASATAALEKLGVMYRIITEAHIPVELMKAAVDLAKSRHSAEYETAKRATRLQQKREAQRRYISKKKKTSL